MSLKGMGDIERGDIADPHYSSLSKIAGGLGVSVGELLEEPVTAGKGEAPAMGLAATERPGELPPSSPELPEKSEDRPWQGMSEEQKEAREHEHNWTTVLSGALDRIKMVQEETRKSGLDFYPKLKVVEETFALLTVYRKAGGAQGSEQLKAVDARINTVLESIERMYRHKGAPLSPEHVRHYERFSKPSPDERASSQDAADGYQVDGANQDAR